MIYMIGFFATAILVCVLALCVAWCGLNIDLCADTAFKLAKRAYDKYGTAKVRKNINAPRSKDDKEYAEKLIFCVDFIDHEVYYKDNFSFVRKLKRDLGVKVSKTLGAKSGLSFYDGSFEKTIRNNGIDVLKVKIDTAFYYKNKEIGEFEKTHKLIWQDIILNDEEMKSKYFKLIDDLYFLCLEKTNEGRKKDLAKIAI